MLAMRMTASISRQQTNDGRLAVLALTLPGRRACPLPVCFEPRYARRAERMKASEIRELLKLLERPGIVSFAGGIPDPALLPAEAAAADLLRLLLQPSITSSEVFANVTRTNRRSLTPRALSHSRAMRSSRASSGRRSLE